MILSKYRIRVLVVLFVMSLPTLIQAQSKTVSLDEAVELFRQNSLERLMLTYGQEIKQGNAQNYKAYPNPELSIFHESLNAGLPDYDETTIQISQPLELLGQPFLRNKSAVALSEAAQLEFEYQEELLVARLKSLYVSYWYQSKRLEVVYQALKSVKETRQYALARREEGTYSTVQLQRFNIEYGRYLKLRDEIQLELTQTNNQLRLLLSLDDINTNEIHFTENFSVVTIADTEDLMVQHALQHRSDLKQIEQLMTATDLQYTVERRERFPDLNLDIGYKTQSNGSEGFVIGGSLKLPLFNQNRGNIIQSRAQARSTETELELKKVRIRNEVVSAYQKVSLLHDQWEDLKGFSGNTSMLEIARLSYKEGEYSLLELLDATEAYVAGQTLFYQTISKYNQALFELDVASGGKLFSNN
jgi:cobalt-zinc-cadmium efflux system outer membrane protein